MKYTLFLVGVFILSANGFAAPDAQKRVALVIGNSAYQSAPLKNPVNDAADMAGKLTTMGFSVEKLLDADVRQMKQAISRFGRALQQENTVGLFYFAGHGIQIKGQNYLLPIGANIENEADVEFEGVDAARILGQMADANNDLNIVILDACRNNPFARSWRSASRGLAKMSAPKGSLILYATSPGDVAADGAGKNGLFTEKLMQSMDVEGLKVEDIFKQTAIAVSKASDREQVPYIEGVILGDFYFIPNTQNAPSVAPEPANGIDRQTDTQPTMTTAEPEIEKSGDSRAESHMPGYLGRWMLKNEYSEGILTIHGRNGDIDAIAFKGKKSDWYASEITIQPDGSISFTYTFTRNRCSGKPGARGITSSCPTGRFLPGGRRHW